MFGTSLKFITATLGTLVFIAFGYQIDRRLPESLDWVVWALAAVAIMPVSLFRSKVIEHLRESQFVDSLTELKNRKYFHTKANEELLKVKKSCSSVSLLMIDIDRFKNINDSYGHLEGDRVIKEIADIIRGSTRAYDTAARWGGEEFAVILPGTDIEAAEKIADRIRINVEEHLFFFEEITRKITVSVGVSATNGNLGMEQLVELADKALYKAKEKRNMTCSYNFYPDNKPRLINVI